MVMSDRLICMIAALINQGQGRVHVCVYTCVYMALYTCVCVYVCVHVCVHITERQRGCVFRPRQVHNRVYMWDRESLNNRRGGRERGTTERGRSSE